MLYACAARFDVTENIENFLDFGVNWALFSSQNFCKMWTVPISFVFDKYCPIMD